MSLHGIKRQRIVIFTPWFYPHIGGVETVTDLLAYGLSQRNEVVVVTSYPSGGLERNWPFSVVRRASWREKWRVVRSADVILMFGSSLRFIGFPLLARKPVVVNHYTWFPWRQRPLICALQWLACLLVTNVAPSRVIAQNIGLRTRVMPNPFDDSTFRAYADTVRTHDLVFLGRLVSEKGVDILLNALASLRTQGLRLGLTVIGKGDAAEVLRCLSCRLGLVDQVRWTGPLSGESLAKELARHRIMVVPSRWREPFGIVALEGLASGCRLVVADNGGLIEAAGPQAVPFSAGDPVALANAIRHVLSTDHQLDQIVLKQHLARFSAENVTIEYESLFHSLTGQNSSC